MAFISFNNQALSAFGQTPANLSWSVSGTGSPKTVELLTVGTGPLNSPTLSSKQVRGILFNSLTTPASGTGLMTAALSAATGTTFRVDRAYQGATLSILYTDNTSTLFVCQTGTTAQSLTANGFDSVSPQARRLAVLGML
jgi:hypothetical protein